MAYILKENFWGVEKENSKILGGHSVIEKIIEKGLEEFWKP